MLRPMFQERGVAILVVLMAIFFVILLAIILLNFMSSQSRLTHHQVSRIQGYYAAMAGINYAYEKLRVGNDTNWPMPAATANYTKTMCNNSSCDIVEPALPLSVKSVSIDIRGNQSSGCTPPANSSIPVCISATADYAYP